MKNAFPLSIASVVLIPSLALAACASANETPTQPPVVPYLEQQPPGLTPELFAPGVVSTDALEINPIFSHEMDAFYFIRQRIGIDRSRYIVRRVDGVWQEPVAIDERIGSIAPDGRTMFLGNEYRTREGDGWSEPQGLGPMFEEFEIMRLTSSAQGTYVFDVREETGTIRISRLVDGERQAPQPFGENINWGRWTAHPFIAPDESYLIWDSERDEGRGSSDLYISFRKADGAWGPAINMGAEINSPLEDIGGMVTPDGKYLFFTRIDLDEDDPTQSKANIYWVDADVIERLRRQHASKRGMCPTFRDSRGLQETLAFNAGASTVFSGRSDSAI